MQKITPEIRAALQKLYDNGVSRPWIARRCGVSNSVVLSWMTSAKSIRESNWRKLYPLLQEYLPENMPPPVDLPDEASHDLLLAELMKHWPRLSISEQAHVVSVAADLLEKKGRAVQPEVLDRGAVGK